MNLINFMMVIVINFTIKVEAYRILGVFPFEFKSHNIVFQALMKGLAKKGHQIDVIAHHELRNPPKNYKTILNLANISFEHPKTKYDNIEEVAKATEDIMMLPEGYGVSVCNIMSVEQMQKLIKNPPKDPPYDVVITEALSSNCYYGLGLLLKVPVVGVSACLEFPPQSMGLGNPLPTSFFPTLIYKQFEIKTFWHRLQNTLRTLSGRYKYPYLTENQSEAMKKYMSANMPSIRKVDKILSLLLVNTYHTIHGIRPKIPAFIEIGGLHIEEDDSSFTPELKQWMDDSINGVILFSFGSIIPIEALSRDIVFSIFLSFAKLAPMRVLIKAKDGVKFPFQMPKNVYAMTWVPQISVLKHPNTRLFISHCGLNSVMEAIYFGVPIIGIPLFYDQQQNVQMVVAKNIGLEINYKEITEKSVDKALQNILTDSKFRDAAKYESQIFRDRPLNPLGTSIYWVEYVIKNGANSLRSPLIDTHWWQIEQLDVYGFLLLCLILIFFAIKAVTVNIFKRFRCKNETHYSTIDSKND